MRRRKPLLHLSERRATSSHSRNFPRKQHNDCVGKHVKCSNKIHQKAAERGAVAPCRISVKLVRVRSERIILKLYPRQYNPLRPYPDEFDRDAARRHRSAFRSLLVNLVGALDVLADTIVVLFPREVPRVRAGGAAFTEVEKWLATPHDLPSGLLSPAQHFVATLHAKLAPIVVSRSGPERDWLPLMRMYRNKAAHLGHQSYTQFG